MATDPEASPQHPATHAWGPAGDARRAAETAGEAGEAGVLARILPSARPSAAAIVPTGDDAAVLAAPEGRYVVTTDLMVEGPDFRRAWHEPHDLGWKACASNLADIAAMGARPTALVVALALPDETPMPWIEAFGAGVGACLESLAPDAGVVGGDLSTAGQVLVSVTAFGDLEGRPAVLRSGARPGDVVALAGDAGRSASGLAALFAGQVAGCSTADGERVGAGAPWPRVREATPPIGGGQRQAEPAGTGAAGRIVAERFAAVLRAQFAPSPPIAAGATAAVAGATAMMDVSDGLLLDATRLARASGVTVELESAALAGDVEWLAAVPGPDGEPIGASAALERCLAGGEDHALLATFPPGAALPPPFRRIGAVARGATGADAAADGTTSPVRVDGVPRAARGWDPYAGR
ncbi:thiamine-monophosphate kinase [Pseudoclavibacter endophyticus]|uniref:Thiamine-monophosphate kinase n=1 Tax=Pseudoclavibacter endophyticus TaxID=1778590 RepID=A0A6H9WNK7_9MICO|nr:thiamine-phosphate kinase [Pseudoclavibacter endophyticus]KAB1649291.1 thiamine-monophosphate kinase [Pseudoclavibacter endophyticus]GGA63813.1 thiamine-monophosphate kinase [Pseudoclavibacter endophyticus]